MSKPISQKIIYKFFKEAAKHLAGDWVLLGGAVLPCVGRELRVTVDIDLAAISFIGTSKQLELMKVAEKINLPVEAINTAAEFFLKKIKGFEKSLVLLYEDKKFKVYRPDVNLFIQLKIGRMTESDLQDCLEFLDFAQEVDETINHAKLLKLINKEIKKQDHRLQRLATLQEKLK